MGKKHTFEYIKKYFTEHNCELLETEYVHCEHKMKYKCNCGNESFISFSSFKSGSRCKLCGIKNRIEKKNIHMNM